MWYVEVQDADCKFIIYEYDNYVSLNVLVTEISF